MTPHDPYLWLEDVDGDPALDWVRARNAESAAALESDDFRTTEKRILEVLDSDAKIPPIAKAGDWYYNVWRDAEHERGLWRRTTLASYRTDAPEWDVLLDLDALAEEEEESWVWHGAKILRTGPLAYQRVLVSLSRGGSDADVTREFDLETRTWVADGFIRPEAKGDVSWIDADTTFVATDTGPGSMTESGYPRIARRWRRGEPLDQSEIVFEGAVEDLTIGAFHDRTPGFERDWVVRATSFYTSERYLVSTRSARSTSEEGEEGSGVSTRSARSTSEEGSRSTSEDGGVSTRSARSTSEEVVLTKLDVPDSSETSVKRDQMLVELRDDWAVDGTTYVAGSLLAIGFAAFLDGARDFTVLYEPTGNSALAGYAFTAHRLVLELMTDVRSRLEILTPPATPDGEWERVAAHHVPELGTLQVAPVDADEDDAVWLYTTDFLTPTTLSLLDLGPHGVNARPVPLKSMPSFFDADGLTVEQHFASSDDGTRVPYFVVRPRDLALDGSAPTLLYGYGGFEISLTPSYSGGLGRAWLERGGVYVVANIRGGGEYGPAWHQAALRDQRPRAYEDFAAVARDLADRGITSPAHLGAMGGSNGGLLVGNMLTQYPELFGAIVVQVPLLDMQRYHLLLAGASWVAEYGDPSTDDREFLATFSPYHLFDADRSYPPVLFTTSTRDDRVHPGHARKMAAMMLDAGKDVTYYENIEGGHGGAATNAQAAHMSALAYEFLRSRLT